MSALSDFADGLWNSAQQQIVDASKDQLASAVEQAAQFGQDVSRTLLSSSGAGGMEEGPNLMDAVKQAGGLGEMRRALPSNLGEVEEKVFEGLEAVREGNISNIGEFLEGAVERVSGIRMRPGEEKGATGGKLQASIDTLKGLVGINATQGDILNGIARLGSSALGAGQIDPSVGVEAGLSNLSNLIGGFGGIGLSALTGDPAMASRMVQEMKDYGIDQRMVDEFTKAMDTNKNGTISAFETQSLLNDSAMIERLSSMDAVTSKMLRDPGFRTRVIKKIDSPSIYGDDFAAQYNQVSLVEQGIANDGSSANQFNVAF